MPRKGNPLLWKIPLLLCSSGYIIYRLFFHDQPLDTTMIPEAFTFPKAWMYCSLVLILVPVNWLTESWKWKGLLRSVGYPGSLGKALRGVLLGLSVGIFTPNRSGEFIGRLADLPQDLRGRAFILTIINSLTQLCVTVGAATLVLILHALFLTHDETSVDTIVAPFREVMGYAIAALLFCFLLLYFTSLLGLSKRFGETLSSMMVTFRRVGTGTVFIALGWSLVRYSVFLLQYWLVLRWFGIIDSGATGWVLIPLIFFVTSVLPGIMFPLDVSVRGAAAIYFLEGQCSDTTAILFASLLIWTLNIAVPALAGSLLWLRKDRS